MTFRKIFSACAVLCALAQPAFAVSDWAIDFQCDPGHWASAPTVTGGMFLGRLEGDCKFKANNGGTLAQLETALSREVIEKAQKVYAGPEAAAFDGMPGTYFDAESTEQMDSLQALVRADLNFANDGLRFVSSTKSKVITGTGMAKNLKSLHTGCEIKLDGPGQYSVHFYNEIQISKPTLIPTGLFKSEVTKGMEDNSKARRDVLINKFLETL